MNFDDIEEEAVIAELHSRMTRHSSDSFDGKVTYAAWTDIPSVRFFPEKDVIVPTALQTEMF